MDPIRKAFKLMVERGLLTCEACRYSPHGAVNAIKRNAERLIDTGHAHDKITGHCFYTEADAQDRDEHGTFYLSYGNINSQEHGLIGVAPRKVGQLVAQCLADAGVGFNWNGDPALRIEVFEPTHKPEDGDVD